MKFMDLLNITNNKAKIHEFDKMIKQRKCLFSEPEFSNYVANQWHGNENKNTNVTARYL